MHLLLIHQNFPGQFRELAPAWLATGHRVTAIGSRSEAPRGLCWQGLDYWSYQIQPAESHSDPAGRERGEAVAHLCRHLLQRGIHPDLVMVHSGWGEALQLRNLFPGKPLLVYPELWGSPEALGYGFDAELGPEGSGSDAPSPPLQLRQRIERQNLLAELAIHQADAVVVPSRSQLASFPTALRASMHLIPEGVDLDRLRPDPDARVCDPALPAFRAGDPVVTLVSRELEPLRGLRAVLRAWPSIAEACPQAALVLVGGGSGGYGEEAPQQASHLQDALEALPPGTDLTRIHRPGCLSYPVLLQLLQCSACHLALSYPYTLSWSTLEALACGAPVVTNERSPLARELRHGQNGLIVPFNQPSALADAVLSLLQKPQLRQQLSSGARTLLAESFSLPLALERYGYLFEQLKPGGQEP